MLNQVRLHFVMCQFENFQVDQASGCRIGGRMMHFQPSVTLSYNHMHGGCLFVPVRETSATRVDVCIPSRATVPSSAASPESVLIATFWAPQVTPALATDKNSGSRGRVWPCGTKQGLGSPGRCVLCSLCAPFTTIGLSCLVGP